MADWRTDDRELLARILMAEAGNQGPIGMTAVGNVIMNRANTTGYGDGIRGVIMKPGQFSPMNSVTGYARGEQGQDIDALRPGETHYMVADSLLSGGAGDITGGATHFFHPGISNPSWAEGKDFIRIGDHVFGSADAGRGRPQATTATQGALPMMQKDQQPQQPRGLLSSLGIQKMEEGAAGETGQRFYERDTFKDTAAVLAQGFAAMGSSPALQKMTADIAGQRSEAKARNKTVEHLRANGRGDLADMVEKGLIGGREAASIMLAQPKDDRTALVKNYEYFIAQGMTPEQAMDAVKPGPTFNMGDVGEGNFLYGSKAGLPAGYRLDKRTGEASVIPGGPADTGAQAADVKAELKDEQTTRAAGVVLEDLGRIQSLISESKLPVTGAFGSLLKGLPGTNAYDVSALIQTVAGNIGFDRLQQMRDASPTGGALGAINTIELTTLQSVLGSLDQAQSQEQFEANLGRLEGIYEGIMRKASAYPNASEFGFSSQASLSDNDPLGLRKGD